MYKQVINRKDKFKIDRKSLVKFRKTSVESSVRPKESFSRHLPVS